MIPVLTHWMPISCYFLGCFWNFIFAYRCWVHLNRCLCLLFSCRFEQQYDYRFVFPSFHFTCQESNLVWAHNGVCLLLIVNYLSCFSYWNSYNWIWFVYFSNFEFILCFACQLIIWTKSEWTDILYKFLLQTITDI